MNVYFDNAATTPIEKKVLDKVLEWSTQVNHMVKKTVINLPPIN